MSMLRSLVLALLTAVVTCHETGNTAQIVPTGLQQQNCGEVMEEVNVCLDRLQDTDDAKQIQKRLEQIFKTCVPSQPKQCSDKMAAIEKCHAQTRTDPTLKKVREEVKGNVTKCYERSPNTRKTGGRPSFPPGGGFGGPSPFGGAPPPPPSAFGHADPCAPTGEQVMCLNYQRGKDQTIAAHGKRIGEQERQCFTKPQLAECRPDNEDLRQCLDGAAQTFMARVHENMKQCVSKAGFELPALPPPPPHPMHGFGG